MSSDGARTDVTTVLFDLDDTLCEYRRPIDEVLDLVFEETGIDPFFTGADWYDVMPVIEEAEDHMDFRNQCFGLLAENAGYDSEVGHEVAAAYNAERDFSDVRFRPGARETLDALAGEYRLGLVTNGERELQRPKLEALALSDTFEHMVFPDHETPAKPDPEPFRRALSALDARPERTLHVGNSLAADVAGAQAAGVRSVWVPHDPSLSAGSYAPDYTLETLHDLENVLG